MATKTKAKTRTTKTRAADQAPPAPWRKKADCVVALGEVTGHYHEVTGAGVAVYDRPDDPEVLLIVAPHGGVVTHQEHAPVTLPPGRYVRRIVREYDHLAEEARAVVD